MEQKEHNDYRKRHDSSSSYSSKVRIHEGTNSHVVASHYNSIEEKGLAERLKSKIFHMRNFNNWVKGMLITEFVRNIRDQNPRDHRLQVLDLCCGKGGDLLKWQKANISHLICTDIADVSVDQCKERYNVTKSRNNRLFSAEFHACDATHVVQRNLYQDPNIKLDLTSCQFAFHYCFESLPQADVMLRNASECLRPGGFFIGTIPDANEIMKRHQKVKEGNKFGNDIYSIELQFDPEEEIPFFGAKYNFHLEEVVDCPEFLVHFPTLVKLAEKHKLKLVLRETFEDYYTRMIPHGKELAEKMRVFETFSLDSRNLSYDDEAEYQHARDFIKAKNQHDRYQVGTLAKSEWEAICKFLYNLCLKFFTKRNISYRFSTLSRVCIPKSGIICKTGLIWSYFNLLL